MIYGYARVSTDGQSVHAQVRQLRASGARKVFREVASGAKTDRAQLRRLLDSLAPGDVVTVTRLDRLARSSICGFLRRITLEICKSVKNQARKGLPLQRPSEHDFQPTT
jgi:DNA invertase Pin-like site-specific DNA recombinase